MKTRFLPIFVLFVFFSSQLFAQSLERKGKLDSNFIFEEHSVNAEIASRSTGTSGTGSNIDVIYHKIYWRLNPDSGGAATPIKYIKGYVQFNFKTTQANVSTISFDINSVLIIDSVTFRAAKLVPASIARAGNIATITLTASLPTNFIDSFTVYYKGVPPAVVGNAQGFQSAVDGASGNILNTLSESYEDRDWWPCKHDMQDKIDSMDITVNVPWGKAGAISFPLVGDTFWVASNGKMVDSTINTIDNSRSFTFKNRYPIASYLVAVSVARYNRYYRTVNVNGTALPVVYNLLIGKTGGTATYNTILSAMDKVNDVVVEFSKRFGDYPFKLEKHGFYDGLVGAGGMEHQTFSAIDPGALTDLNTLVHELMHQWFGDNVTFSNWNDLWLAEGFAQYSEILAKELVPSIGTPAAAFTLRNTFKNSALGYKSQSAWIPNSNTGTSNLIWTANATTGYGGTVYKRGCMVVSMLRAMCGDTIFFNALKKYQTELAGKSATTDTLRNYFNRELGRDISVFFNDYIGGSDKGTIVGGIGNPINVVNWNAPTTFGQSGKRLVISMGTQTKSTGNNVTYFRGPVQIHVKGASPVNDTTITIFDWGPTTVGGTDNRLSYAGKGISIPVAGNKLTFDLSFAPTSVLYDDSSRTLSTGSTTKLTLPALEGYVWLGTSSTVWGTAANWAGNLVPPIGGDVTIATTASNHPLLPVGNTIVGPLSIMPGKLLYLNDNTLTINNSVRYTGLISGSPTSNIIVADQAATLNFDQTSAATRSLFTLTLNPKASATVGTGLLEIYGGLSLPTSTSLNVKSANLLIR
jgi:Peptidase family M1 domain